MTSPDAPADTRDMFMVHTMFRREFAALPALARDAAAGDAGRVQLVADHIGFLAAVLEAHHHAEDAHLWPKLLERGSEEVAPLVRVMRDHHERIEQLTAQTLAALGEWRRDATADRGRLLAGLLDGLTAVLYEHMSLEEQRILPLAEKYVTAAEWQAMAGHTGAALPPERMPLLFGMTLYEANPEVIEATLAALPPEMRTTLQEQGARDFAAHSQRVHGTPTPRRSGPLTSSRSA